MGKKSFKFNPSRALLQDGRVHVSDGTKGGRERMIHHVSEKGREVIKYVRSVAQGTNTMARGMTERQWNGLFYRTLKEHGITKGQAGASAHGLRHAYAQQRYEQITGFAPPVKFASRQDFKINAEHTAGANWRNLDRDARLIIKGELGHGPDRDDVTSQYLGSGS